MSRVEILPLSTATRSLGLIGGQSKFFLGMAPIWRHNDLMDSVSKKDNRVWRNLRLLPDLCSAVDAACEVRVGKVSFNTWIIEAVQEKLAREGGNDNSLASVRRTGRA